MPDYASLKTELALPEYAGLSDANAAAHYNAKVSTSDQPLITVNVLRTWAAQQGARSAIEAGASSASPVIASICLSVRDFLIGGGNPMDLSEPSIQQMVGALVQGGILTADQQTSLLALRTVAIPYYGQAGQFGVPVTDQDIHFARSL